MLRFCFALLWVFFLPLGVFNVLAVPGVMWNATLGGEDGDYARCVVATGDGGFLLGGASGISFAVWRVNGSGCLEWEETYRDYWCGQVYSISPCNDGGFIMVVGEEWHNLNQGSLIVKIDGDGKELWRARYGTPNSSPLSVEWADAGCMAPTADGGLVLGGVGYFLLRVDPEGGRELTASIHLLKIDEKGTVVWNRSYPDQKTVPVRSIASTRDRGFIILAYTYLMKVDALGGKVWVKSYEPEITSFSCMTPCREGGFILVGWTTSTGRLQLLKVNEEGDKIWHRYHPAVAGSKANYISQTPDGGFLIVGGTQPYDDQKGDAYLLKIDDEGEEVWSLVLGCDGSDEAYGFTVTVDRGFLIVGKTNSAADTPIQGAHDSASYDVFLARIEGSPIELVELDPRRIMPGIDESLLIRVKIRAPHPGWASVSAVWTNVSSLEHSQSWAMHDDGGLLHGDEKRADGVYSAKVPIPPDLLSGRKTIEVGFIDQNGKTYLDRGYVFVYPLYNQVIYDEDIEPWSPLTCSAHINTQTTSPVYSGQVSISTYIWSGGHLEFVPPGEEPIHTFGYTSLDMAINPGNCIRFYPRIYVGVEGQSSLEQICLADTGGLDLSFTQNQWTNVSIPLHKLDMVNRSLTSIRIGGYFDSTFYLDTMRLTTIVVEHHTLSFSMIIMWITLSAMLTQHARTPLSTG